MRLLALAMLCALAGCESVFSPYPNATAPPARDSYLVAVDFDVSQCPPGSRACAEWVGNLCQLHLPREAWADCSVHELAHCFNGTWHGDVPTDCNVP